MIIEIKTPQTEFIERKGFGYVDLPKLDLDMDDILKRFEENHKKYKAVVKEILETYPLSTNNDFILYIEFLRVLNLVEVTSGKDNFIFKIPRDKIKFIPSPESCSRARRSLNNKGIGLPTNPFIYQLRMRKQKSLKKYFNLEKNNIEISSP